MTENMPVTLKSKRWKESVVSKKKILACR